MVGRKKKAKLCDKGSQQDRISQLPEALISEILAHLPTKDAVRTSVLTTRWRNLWKCVPGLDLDTSAFSDLDAFVSFGEKFFETQRESWIRKLKLRITYYSENKAFLTPWIDVVTKRRIQHLNICGDGPHCAIMIPVRMYTCETLVQLRLSRVVLPEAEFVSLPCLKTMHLECIEYHNEETLERLILNSPVLEELTIIRLYEHRNTLNVRSKSLKRIDINENTQVVIEAPLLQCLTTRIFATKNFQIMNPSSRTKLDIDVAFRHADYTKSFIIDLLADVSRVRDLVISSALLQNIISSSGLLKFRELTRLNAKFSKFDLAILPAILESCPNLESLIVQVVKDPRHKMNREPNVMFSTVPSCLVTSLKYVELKRVISRYEGEVELVRYLLKNSTVLEKLKLDTYYTKKAMRAFLKQVVAMPRCSSACQVIVP